MEMKCEYKLVYIKKAINDVQNLKSIGIIGKAKILCMELKNNPKITYSKQLLGNLKSMRFIRINLKHLLIYEILGQEKIVKILSLWRHY